MKRRGLRTPGGPWGTILRLLESADSQVFLGTWIALAALIGVVSDAGMHPMEHLGLRLPLILLPFCVLARGLKQGGSMLWIAGVWTAGFLLAVVSSWQPAGTGVAEVSTRGPVERYQRAFRGRWVDSYLGGALSMEQRTDGVALKLGLPGQEPEETVFSATEDREKRLGPWVMHLRGFSDSGGAPQVAELSLVPRDGGPEIRLTAPMGLKVPIPTAEMPGAENTPTAHIVVRRILKDFRKSLGPAAQMEVSWAEGAETGWHFLDAPELDARHGASPWKIRVVALTSGRARRVGVRPATWPLGASLGWGVMALALLLGGMTTRESA